MGTGSSSPAARTLGAGQASPEASSTAWPRARGTTLTGGNAGSVMNLSNSAQEPSMSASPGLTRFKAPDEYEAADLSGGHGRGMAGTDVRQRDGRLRSVGGPVFGFVLSKQRRPLRRPVTVRRSPLIERLRGGDPRPIVSVAAPAGYGKTALLSQWAEPNGQSFAGRRHLRRRMPLALARCGLASGAERANTRPRSGFGRRA